MSHLTASQGFVFRLGLLFYHRVLLTLPLSPFLHQGTAAFCLWPPVYLLSFVLEFPLSPPPTSPSYLTICHFWGFPGDTVAKNARASAGDTRDMGSIPGSGTSPGEGNGNPLQCSCLGNPTDRGACGPEEPMGLQRGGDDSAHACALAVHIPNTVSSRMIPYTPTLSHLKKGLIPFFPFSICSSHGVCFPHCMLCGGRHSALSRLLVYLWSLPRAQ